MSAPLQNRLLIVDDDPAIHELIRAMLAGEDWEADSVFSGEDALERLQTDSYALVLADILMPGMDGLALLGQLRVLHPDTQVVMMTVKNTTEHILGSLRQHAASYISKPFSRETLLTTLQNALLTSTVGDDIKILSDKPDWISLEVRCRLAAADHLTQFVRELPSDLEPDQREQIAFAFRELLINAIEHGGHFDPQKTVSLSYIRTARSIVYYIRDPGEGFSMDKLAHAAVGNPGNPVRHLEVRGEMGIRPGGFGMMMTRNFADELIYSRKGNEVLFIKYL